MGEADTRLVELDDTFADGLVRRAQDGLAVAAGVGDEIEGRSGKRRHTEQNLQRVFGETGETVAEQVVQALRDPKRPPPGRTLAGPDELAPEFEREERIATRCLLDPRELRPRQLECQPLPQQVV